MKMKIRSKYLIIGLAILLILIIILNLLVLHSFQIIIYIQVLIVPATIISTILIKQIDHKLLDFYNKRENKNYCKN